MNHMSNSIQTLAIHDPEYPEYLRNIPNPPKQLYYIGNLVPLLSMPRLAVIGSRRVSPYGRGVTQKLAEAAAAKGVVIVSGLALGVDGIGHQAALDVKGKTIAVLAGGLDIIHPSSHHRMAEEIVWNGGAIISEYPLGTTPYKTNFIARNRIVSGLSDAVLITEAAEKSGTLHTANFALEQGKTVMAVPGNITSLLSAGTNNLIKAGAMPITSPSDILNTFDLSQITPEQARLPLNAEEAVILQLMAEGVSDSSELLSRSKLSAPVFSQTLTMLEITGKVRPLGAGHWTTV
jgi:DNA processing protein